MDENEQEPENAEELEYDLDAEDSEEIEDEAEDSAADESAEEPEEEAEEDTPAAAPVMFEAGEDADDAVLRNLLGDEAYAALMRKNEQRISRQLQAMSVANIHVTTAAAQNPQLFSKYGARLQHTISQLSPDLRAKPEAVNVAVANLLMEEAKTKGLGAALANLAGLAGGKGTPAPRAPKAPIPASQRPPSPNVGSGTTRKLNNDQARIETIKSRYGLNDAEARAALQDEGVLR